MPGYVIYIILGLLLATLASSIVSLFVIIIKRRSSSRIVYNRFACRNNGVSMDDENIQTVHYDIIGMP